MHNWRIVDNTYLYDGSIHGLFSLISHCIELKLVPNKIMAENDYTDNLIEMPVFINSDNDKYNALLNAVKKISAFSLYNIYTSFLSSNENKDSIIFKYALSVLKHGKKFDFMKSNEVLIQMNNISKKVVRVVIWI